MASGSEALSFRRRSSVNSIMAVCFTKEAKQIDEPLVKLIDRLQADFELIRLVRFAHVGD